MVYNSIKKIKRIIKLKCFKIGEVMYISNLLYSNLFAYFFFLFIVVYINATLKKETKLKRRRKMTYEQINILILYAHLTHLQFSMLFFYLRIPQYHIFYTVFIIISK